MYLCQKKRRVKRLFSLGKIGFKCAHQIYFLHRDNLQINLHLPESPVEGLAQTDLPEHYRKVCPDVTGLARRAQRRRLGIVQTSPYKKCLAALPTRNLTSHPASRKPA